MKLFFTIPGLTDRQLGFDSESVKPNKEFPLQLATMNKELVNTANIVIDKSGQMMVIVKKDKKTKEDKICLPCGKMELYDGHQELKDSTEAARAIVKAAYESGEPTLKSLCEAVDKAQKIIDGKEETSETEKEPARKLIAENEAIIKQRQLEIQLEIDKKILKQAPLRSSRTNLVNHILYDKNCTHYERKPVPMSLTNDFPHGAGRERYEETGTEKSPAGAAHYLLDRETCAEFLNNSELSFKNVSTKERDPSSLTVHILTIVDDLQTLIAEKPGDGEADIKMATFNLAHFAAEGVIQFEEDSSYAVQPPQLTMAAPSISYQKPPTFRTGSDLAVMIALSKCYSEFPYFKEEPYESKAAHYPKKLEDNIVRAEFLVKQLVKKAIRLNRSGHHNAAVCMMDLHDKLSPVLKLFASKSTNTDLIREKSKECFAALDAAKPILKEHRDSRWLLAEIGAAFALCIVGYLFALGVNYQLTGRVGLFSQTRSERMVDEVEVAIKALAPN